MQNAPRWPQRQVALAAGRAHHAIDEQLVVSKALAPPSGHLDLGRRRGNAQELRRYACIGGGRDGCVGRTERATRTCSRSACRSAPDPPGSARARARHGASHGARNLADRMQGLVSVARFAFCRCVCAPLVERDRDLPAIGPGVGKGARLCDWCDGVRTNGCGLQHCICDRSSRCPATTGRALGSRSFPRLDTQASLVAAQPEACSPSTRIRTTTDFSARNGRTEPGMDHAVPSRYVNVGRMEPRRGEVGVGSGKGSHPVGGLLATLARRRSARVPPRS